MVLSCPHVSILAVLRGPCVVPGTKSRQAPHPLYCPSAPAFNVFDGTKSCYISDTGGGQSGRTSVLALVPIKRGHTPSSPEHSWEFSLPSRGLSVSDCILILCCIF